jgi:two-component system cell cycle response regulator CtrA
MQAAAISENEITRLRARNAELEEEVRQLRELLKPSLIFPREWKMMGGEQKILASLYAAPNGFRSTAALHAALSRIDKDTEIKNVYVYVCKLRKSLARAGILIETVRGQGYRLPSESRAILTRVLERTPRNEAVA